MKSLARGFLITANLMAVTLSNSNEVSGAQVDGGEFDCLPVATFGLKGLRLSEPEDSIRKTLGRAPRGRTPNKSAFYIVTCPVDGRWVQEDYVTLEFDSDSILVSIEYAVDRP